MTRILTIVVALLATHVASAEIYELPPPGYDVIGAVSTVTARGEDTLVDIARRHGLGYEDIVRANPDVNVWVPGEGTEVVLPTQFVLPPGPRKGVVLNLAEYRLYYYPAAKDGDTAYVMTYPISIGRMDWETPLGKTSVISKVTNPSWYVPKSVLAEHAAEGRPLPRIVPPGPDNPLGKYAMRLGLPGYLIHGTNRPAGVGMRVTHGCVRMFPEDIEYLFGKIDVDTPVRIINAPVKMGWVGDALVMEVHPVLEVAVPPPEDGDVEEVSEETLEEVVQTKDPLTYVTEQFIATTAERAGQLDWHLAEQLVERSDGIPVTVGEGIKNAAASAAFE
jgi:L,D-transpeptidase ErfK/SrfK